LSCPVFERDSFYRQGIYPKEFPAVFLKLNNLILEPVSVDYLQLIKTGEMPDIVKYFVIIIVVWRITHLFSMEDGPFDLIFRIRKLLGSGFFGKLMDCFYCLSIWVSLLLSIIIGIGFAEMIILCLYYSGAAIILEKFTNKNFE